MCLYMKKLRRPLRQLWLSWPPACISSGMQVCWFTRGHTCMKKLQPQVSAVAAVPQLAACMDTLQDAGVLG